MIFNYTHEFVGQKSSVYLQCKPADERGKEKTAQPERAIISISSRADCFLTLNTNQNPIGFIILYLGASYVAICGHTSLAAGLQIEAADVSAVRPPSTPPPHPYQPPSESRVKRQLSTPERVRLLESHGDDCM